MLADVIGALRQPAYTGDNRCEPCTVLNVAIAVVIGLVLSRKSKRLAAAVFGVSAILIYLRGYLVPGTPSLTKQYLPATVLRWFGKEPEPDFASGLDSGGAITQSESSRLATTTDPDGDSLETETETEPAPAPAPEPEPDQYLLERAIIEPCEEIDDLCLTDAFETAWTDEIEAIDTEAITAADAAAVFGIEGDEELEIAEFGDARVMTRGGVRIGKWPSQAALVADVTGARVLSEWDGDWEHYTPESRGQLLTSLRLFLETCPTSGGAVSMDEETVESCCTSHEIIAITCEETGERLFEHPVADLETDPEAV